MLLLYGFLQSISLVRADKIFTGSAGIAELAVFHPVRNPTSLEHKQLRQMLELITNPSTRSTPLRSG